MSKRVALILAGCGHLDGSEIRETISSLLALDQAGAQVTIFAPNQKQKDVMNHYDQTSQEQERNIFEEASRLARGDIHELKELTVDNFDALMIPGGFGVAKNLCTFAFEGSNSQVLPAIESIIQEFHQHRKPIGAVCIAPALIAKALEGRGISVTIGKHPETAKEIEKTGASHHSCEVSEIHVDENNKIVTSPAYMYDNADLKDVFKGISSCVQKMLEMAD
jgi:enhancing lycopene biosynthesis protein 2